MKERNSEFAEELTSVILNPARLLKICDTYDYDFDDLVEDIDFSEIQGDSFKKTFSSVNKKIAKKKAVAKKPKFVDKPIKKGSTARMLPKGKQVNIPVEKRAKITSSKKKVISKVLVPRDRSVIVEGISKFILSDDKKNTAMKQIGYYKGEKLKPLILIFNNSNSALDFDLEIFNPSMPLDYLYSTSQNLNNKVQVAGGVIQYTDVLFNLLANPTLIPNCKFVFDGPQIDKQIAIPLQMTNKSIEGVEYIEPLNLALKIDNLQVANNIVFFDMQNSINRPFIPDGMDVIKYKVLAGMTVTMAFFYKQVSLKKVFYKEARDSKKLM